MSGESDYSESDFFETIKETRKDIYEFEINNIIYRFHLDYYPRIEMIVKEDGKIFYYLLDRIGKSKWELTFWNTIIKCYVFLNTCESDLDIPPDDNWEYNLGYFKEPLKLLNQEVKKRNIHNT
jgi:hypothetical protein